MALQKKTESRNVVGDSGPAPGKSSSARTTADVRIKSDGNAIVPYAGPDPGTSNYPGTAAAAGI